MGSNIFQRIIWFIGLVLLQALILNNIHILGYATPFLYIYFIVKINSTVSRNALLLWAFFLGLCVDIFSTTPGMNAASTVALAFICPTYLNLFTPRENLGTMTLSIKSMGNVPFIKYLFVSVLTHHAILFGIAFFSFADVPTLVINVLGSTLLTFVCILAIEGIRR